MQNTYYKIIWTRQEVGTYELGSHKGTWNSQRTGQERRSLEGQCNKGQGKHETKYTHTG